MLPILRHVVLCIVGINLSLVSDGQTNKPTTATQTPAPTLPVHMKSAYPSGILVNYVRTRQALEPFSDETALNNSPFQVILGPLSKQREATQYLDGLGRPIQTVMRLETSLDYTKFDLIIPVEYDNQGREVYKHLPRFGTTSGKFILNAFAVPNPLFSPEFPGEQVYYSQTEYEASPLNRILKQMAPGNSWAGSGKGTTFEHLLNTSEDLVQDWRITCDPLDYESNEDKNVPSIFAATYGAGELFKNVTIDENNNASVEYTTKNGLVVLKKAQIGTIASDYCNYNGFLSTYYVYDDLNQLRFVIPPKAVEAIRSTGWQLSSDIVNELCFRYVGVHGV
jgi:hypothetical protein